jgi:molybdopterin converting factor small subunit
MRVTVKLFAGLRAKLPQGRPAELTLPAGATVAQALAALDVPVAEAKIILLAGRHAGLDSVLAEGAVLSVFPPVGGG